jgi:hypothetical protein
MKKRILYRLLWIKGIVKNFIRTNKINFVEDKYPGYINYINKLNQGGAMGGRKAFPWRALEQIRVLNIVNPSSIVEFGSGTSTALFFDYLNSSESSKDSLSMISYDESEKYATLTQNSINEYISAENKFLSIKHASKKIDSSGSYYDIDHNINCDLVYIDGPTVEIINSSKTANQDILKMFKNNNFPNAIMIDGRIHTAQAILDEYPDKYKFFPSAYYSLHSSKNFFSNAFNILFSPYERHSLFIKNK